MLRSALIALVVSLAAPLAAQAQTAEAAEPAADAAAPVLPAIAVVAAVDRPMVETVLASGLIGPVEEVNVAPLIEGQPIEALMVDVGDTVAEGEVLARLSVTTLELQKSQFTASLAAARATIAQAEAQLLDAQNTAAEAMRVNDRTAALRAQGAASQAAADTASANMVSANARVSVAQQSLEASRANLALVEAQLANVELNLQRTEVRAPVSGKITARNATLGSVATAAGTPMFTIIRDGALELRADVAETDLLQLTVGQKAELTLVGASAALTGSIRMVEPTIDTQTRMGRVRIAIDDSESVRMGMFAEARIITRESAGVAVPVTAVNMTADGDMVMVVADGEVARVPVTTGIRDGAWVQVTEGLKAGDTVVQKAGAFVRPGDRVNPVIAAMN
jgi:HlyD family secretion protein